MGQGRDMSLAYILVTATYMLIGASFYIAFPLPKSCIEDVSITAINIMTTFPTSWLSIFHLAVNLEKLSLWPSLLITRTCWTTSTSTMCWRWPPRSSSSSRCSPSSPSSCTSSGLLSHFLNSTVKSHRVIQTEIKITISRVSVLYPIYRSVWPGKAI